MTTPAAPPKPRRKKTPGTCIKCGDQADADCETSLNGIRRPRCEACWVRDFRTPVREARHVKMRQPWTPPPKYDY